MAINSKRKGSRGEVELASILKDYGYDTRRSVQYNGFQGEADVVGLPYIHIEVKRVEKLNIYDAICQAIRDAKKGRFPAVFHRRNNREWLVTMRLSDWIELYREYEIQGALNFKEDEEWQHQK